MTCVRNRIGSACTVRNPDLVAAGANSGHRSVAMLKSGWLTGAPVR